MADIPEMGRLHYIVMHTAIDAGWVEDASLGLLEVAATGERFVVFEPQPIEAVQQATVELLAAGYVSVHRYRPDREDFKDYSPEEAQAVVRDPASWRGEGHWELAVTDDGWKAWRELDKLYGAQARRASEVADQRSEEFYERHPDFKAKQLKYFEDMRRWVETGDGKMPEFPSYPDEPPPYDGDVPRYEKPDEPPAV